jgi:hypothetical protein
LADTWIHGSIRFFMIRTQTIFLDQTPYDIQSGSLILPGTEILNIIIEDGTQQTDCQFIGDRFEYKPLVWLEHERQTISKLKELNFTFLSSKASDNLKNIIAEKFPHVLINFYHSLLFGKFYYYEQSKKYVTNFETPRQENFYLSIGTMRLQRFYLTWYLQRVGIDNFGRPGTAPNILQDFKYQIEKMSRSELDLSKYDSSERRFFGEVHQLEFESKQMAVLTSSRINIISHYPFYDYITHFYDEKLTLPVRAKTLPFFFDNKGANENIKDLGFEPYVGFDYSAERIGNLVERWETLLGNNKKFFLNEKESKMIYDANRDIIENNYTVFMQTDWRKRALAELSKLPDHIKDLVIKNTNYLKG